MRILMQNILGWAVACIIATLTTPPVFAAVGQEKSLIDQLFGPPYAIQENSSRYWTDKEWEALSGKQAESYGYSIGVGELSATLWVKFDRNNLSEKETLLLNEPVKIRHLEKYMPALYALVTDSNAKAVIIKSFPKDQLGIIAPETSHAKKLVRFILSADDKTCINMHSKIQGIEISTIAPEMISKRLKTNSPYQCDLNENTGKVAEDIFWKPTDNYFIPQLYFSERLVPRKGTDLIVIHHAAMPTSTSRADIHDLHLSNGWAGIGYHKLVFADGKIETGRNENVVGAHSYGANRRSLGIVLVGNFDLEVPDKTHLQAAANLTKELMKKYHVPSDKVLPHRSVTEGTVCPGLLFPWQEFTQLIR